MNSYIKALTPMLLAVLVGSLTFIFAQSERGDVGKSPVGAKINSSALALSGGKLVRGFPPAFAEQLNLTELQKSQIEQLHEKSQSDSKSYFEQIKTADAQLRSVIENENFDESRAREIISEKSRAFAELEIVRLRTQAAIKNLLSDEQKQAFSRINSSRPIPPPGGGKLGMPPLPPLPPDGNDSF